MISRLLDDFADLTAWTAITSGLAQLSISPGEGPQGSAMRLDFDFMGGGGFVVVRKLFPLALPENYAFSFKLKGSAPDNIFEFKLVDDSGQNVWRYREEALPIPLDWQAVRIKSRQIDFAWGPLGGGSCRSAAAIELVIAAGPGGKGSVWIADLQFADETYRLTPKVQASSWLPAYPPSHIFEPQTTGWRSASNDPQQVLIDFGQEREFGGMGIVWDPEFKPKAVEVQIAHGENAWQTVFSAEQGVSRRTHVYLPGGLSRRVRLKLAQSETGQGFGILGIDFKPFEFSKDINAFFTHLAQANPPGWHPKYFQGRQTYWTPVGTGEDVTQALFNEEGLVEVDKGSFSLEPFLWTDGRLLTWAEVEISQQLEDGCLPIPSALWRTADLTLRTTAFATGTVHKSTLFVRYRLENLGTTPRNVVFFAAIRPFQVTPTWQHWTRFGGVSAIHALSGDGIRVLVNGEKAIYALSPPTGFGAAAFEQGEITEYLQSGQLPGQASINDGFGHASGAWRFDRLLEPGAAEEIFLAVPFGTLEGGKPMAAEVSGREQFAAAVEQWRVKLGGIAIELPPEAQVVIDTWKTAAAHILINRDGPALQPGPRRYSRSWIRDGALMGAALSRSACNGPMRDFVRWYASFQTEDGNLPDCTDPYETEWLLEYDCWGEFIYAVMDYYRFSGDRAWLEEMWPAVAKSVAYMETLRGKRMGAEFQTTEKRAYYGLLPESMSHEGYMAHPVHAYWDDFWALRGFKDAQAMAEALGLAAEAGRLAALRDDFCANLYASLNLTIAQHGLDFVPGSVEFADFDPAATAIALSVIDETHRLPAKAIKQTFEKYLAGFRQRVRGEVSWNNYSAYEIRIIGALVRLGLRDCAHELLEFFLADRRIVAWNQWPEISWHDPQGPSFIGDMPHSWISGEYILAVRSLFAYEREADQSLVLAAGVAWRWLAGTEGIMVGRMPCVYGQLQYTLRQSGPDSLLLNLAAGIEIPPGGIVVMPPLPRPLRQVEINGQRLTHFTDTAVNCQQCPADIVLQF